MKKITQLLLCFLILFVSSKTFSQTIDTSTIEGLYQYIFENLDKTQIPANYLQEYGVPLLNMQTFNGTLTDSNKVDISTWRALYWQMNTAYTGTGTNSFAAPDTANTAIKNLMSDSLPVPVPVLFANYDVVKPNAFTANLLKIQNNQVLDVAGRTTSPYAAKKLFAAAPIISSTSTGTATFIFQKSIFFKNLTANVNSFYIDFADGQGYQAVGWNTPITVSYTDTGTKTWKIKMLLNNGNFFECYSQYYVAQINNSQTGRYSSFPDDTHYFFSDANQSGGTAYIKYTSQRTSHKIIKPLIVVEGYDIYSAAPDLQPLGPYGYSDFIDAINAPQSQYDFNYHLDDIAGYDLIFVQFNNGTDDIKRNAVFLENVINWINQQKIVNGSNEQNVVIGLSMGGLVARYALADMTKTLGTTSTGTRLLITHDSPHRGANVPLGYQYLIEMAGQIHLFGYDVRRVFPQYDEAINLLNQPATQQLLLYRATGETTSVGNTFLDGDYRSKITFSGSDPQPSYQFIATSLGSECADPLFASTQSLINADAIGNGAGLLFFIPLVTYNLDASLQAWALPDNGLTNEIANVSLSSKFRLFGIITINKTIYNQSGYAPGYQLPVDGAPGGTEIVPVNKEISGAIFRTYTGIINIIGYYKGEASTAQQAFDFVPAASALDISPFNSSTLTQKFVSGVNPNYPSTSSNYIAQETFTQNGSTISNNSHIQFTARNAQWLYDQMEGIPDNLSCSSECQPDLSISGADLLCTNSVYSISGVPAGVPVSWSALPANYVSFSPNNSATTTVTGIIAGNVTLTATLDNCNNYSKLIHVGGYSSSDYPVTGPSSVCKNYYVTYNTNTLAGATNYAWFYPSSWTYVDGQNTPSLTLITGTATGYFQVGVRVANACDAGGSPGIETVQVNNCGGFAFTATPNPSTGNIIVSTSQLSGTQSSGTTAEKIYAINVFDQSGTLKKQYNYSGGITNTTINISDLIAGIYVIQVYDGNEWTSRQIIKQ